MQRPTSFRLSFAILVLVFLGAFFQNSPVQAAQNCIGLNYEQVINGGTGAIPSLAIDSIDGKPVDGSQTFNVGAGQSITFSASSVVDEANGAKAFYFWCADHGSFAYLDDPSYANIQYTAPQASSLNVINIDVTVGDGLGFIDSKELTLNIVDGESESDPDSGDTDPPALQVPTLIHPTHTSANNELIINFDWTDVASASEYRIQVSKSSNFETSADGRSCSNCILNTVSSISSFLVENNLDELKEFLANNTEYFWRVRAASVTQGFAPWSQVFSFKTKETLTEADCDYQCLKVFLPKTPGTNSDLSVVQIESFTELSWEAISNFSPITNVELYLVKGRGDGSSTERVWVQNLNAAGSYSYGPVSGDDISSDARIKAIATLQNGQQFFGMSPSFKILAGSEEGDASIFGLITDAQGDRIIASQVSVQSYNAGSLPWTVTTDAGRYEISNLSGGTYRLTFWVDSKLNPDKFIPLDYEVAVAGSEQKEFNVSLERRGSKGLVGKVLDVNGVALTQANIEIQSYTSGDFHRPIIEEDGSFVAHLPGGRYRSTFFAPGSEFIPQDHEFDLAEGELKTLDVVLERRKEEARPILESCRAWFDAGYEHTGYYHIDTDGKDGPATPFEVWCDMAPFVEERDEELRIKNPPGLRMYISFDDSTLSADELAGEGVEFSDEELSFDDGSSLNFSGLEIIPGRFGNAFDLTYQELSLPYDHRHMLDNNAVTVTAWVNANHGARVFGQLQNYELKISRRLVPGCTGVEASTSIVPGKWNFIACTFDGQYSKIYVDGVLSAYKERNVGVKSTKYQDIAIGGGFPVDSDNDASFKVDELRLYNRALNSKEINALFENNQEQRFPEADLEDQETFNQIIDSSNQNEESNQGPSRENVDPAIVVQYKFDDKEDREVALDESRNYLDARVRASWDNYDSYMLYDPKGSSGALSVMNTSAYAYVPYSPKIDIPGDQLTVGAWVQLRSDTTGLVPGGSRYGTMINKGVMNNKTSEKGHSYTLGSRTSLVRSGRYYKPQDTLFCEIDTEEGRVYIPSGEINGWTGVLCVYDGSKVSMYINGKLYTSRNLTGKVINSPMPLVLGARSSSNDDPGNFDIPIHTQMKGNLDDVIVLNRALEEKEIAAWSTFHRLPYPADYESVEDLSPTEDIVAKEFENYKAPQALLNFKFNEGQGLRAIDSTNNLIHGAVNGATWQASNIAEILAWSDFDAENLSLALDGNDDYVVVPYNNKLDVDLNQFTVGLWVYPEDDNRRMVLVNKGSHSHLVQNLDSHSYTLGLESDGRAFCELTTDKQNAYVNSGDSVPLNLWSQIYCSYNGKELSLYVNGKKVSSRSQQGVLVNSYTPLIIGAELDSEDAESNYLLSRVDHFEGQIDDFILLNKSLSAAEIQYIFDYGQFPDPSNESNEEIDFLNDSKLYLPFDEGSGNIVRDAKNRFTGNLYSQLSVPTVWRKGKINQGLYLQGRSNVKIPHSPELDINRDQLTISAWIYPKSSTLAEAIVFRHDGYDNPVPFSLQTGQGGKLSCSVNTDGRSSTSGYGFSHGASVTSTKTMKTYEWHHVVCTYDGKYLRLYVDGKPSLLEWYDRGTFTDVKAPLRGIVKDGDNNGLFVGTYHSNLQSASSGMLDELMIFDQALSADQIERLYEEQNTKDPNPGELPRIIYSNNFNRYGDGGDTSGHGHGFGGFYGYCPSSRQGDAIALNTGSEQNFYAYVPAANTMQVTGDSFTYSVWVQPAPPPRFNYYPPVDRTVLQKRDSSGRTLYGMKLSGSYSYPRPSCSVNVNGVDYTATASRNLQGAYYWYMQAPWSKVSCQYDKGRLSIYVNDQQQGSAYVPNNFKDSQGELYVGVNVDYRGYRTNYMKGCLDELKLVDSAVAPSSL